jgi:Uma2 family endonuclease
MAQRMTLPPFVQGQWTPMSSEEFDEWVPAGMKAEWVDGKGMLFVTNSEPHVRLQLLLARLLATFLDIFDLGTLYVAPFEMRILSGTSRRQPDLFVVLHDRRHLMRHYRFDGPADFVAEFVSEHNAEVDRVDKFRDYAAAGIPEYLMVDTVDPERDVALYRRNDTGDYDRVQPDEHGRLHSMVLPGFWIDPAWFRQDPLPNHERLMMKIAPDAYWRYLSAIHHDESGE